MLDKDFKWELEIARRKKRWKTREEELRSENRNGKVPEAEEGPSLQVGSTSSLNPSPLHVVSIFRKFIMIRP